MEYVRICGKIVHIIICCIYCYISVTTFSSILTLASSEEFHAFSSPEYPENYPNNRNRTFIIRSPIGSHVKLTFLDLSIQGSCTSDSLIIFDGNLHFMIKKNKDHSVQQYK